MTVLQGRDQYYSMFTTEKTEAYKQGPRPRVGNNGEGSVFTEGFQNPPSPPPPYCQMRRHRSEPQRAPC